MERTLLVFANASPPPVRRQAITWTNADLLSIGRLGTYFIEIRIETDRFSLKKMRLKMPFAKWWPLCAGGGGGGGGRGGS